MAKTKYLVHSIIIYLLCTGETDTGGHRNRTCDCDKDFTSMRSKQTRDLREVLNDFHLTHGHESGCTNHLDILETNMEETEEILLRKC